MSTSISTPHGREDRPDLQAHGRAQRATLADSTQQRVAGGVTALAVMLLTSAIFVSAIQTIYSANRAVLLAVEYLIWAVTGGCLMLQLKPPRHGQLRAPANKWLVTFLFALFASGFLIWWNELRSNVAGLIQETFALAFLALPFFVLDRAAKAAPISRVVMMTCHVVFAACLISILGEVSGLLHYEGRLGRYFGFLGDQAAWALTLPLLVYFSSSRFALAAVAILGLALTASRAPALCVAASLLLLLIFSHGRRLQYVLTLVPLAMISILQSGVFATLFGRIGTIHISSSDRVVTAQLGLKIFRDSPIYGGGYNSFTYYFPRRAHGMELGQLPTQTSTFVQMLSDGGLLLFLPYLGFVIAATLAALHLMKRSRALPDSGPVNGAAAWLLAMLWVNQSAAWWIVGSYVGPLVLGIAGVVVGYWARIRRTPRTDPAWGLASPILPA